MIYLMQAGERGPVKVGWVRECSLASVEARRSALQTGCPHALEVLAAIPGGQDVEALLHEYLSEHRINGEWFMLDPAVFAKDGLRFGPDDLYEWAGKVVAAWIDGVYGAREAA